MFETAEQVYEHLLSRAPENKMEPRMQPMRDVMALLGDPQDSAPVIHLTGTNGKTTTARIIEQVLIAHGLRTGRYTSPHLSHVTERITLDGQPVEDETFVRIYNEIAPLIDIIDAQLEEAGEQKLTYFETVTALGFAIFADAPVDVMVLEVGLGGITDATNVADAQVSVVTPIAVDHADLLGDTPGVIAVEKAGIIKEDGFLVSAAQEPEAAQVLLDAAREKQVNFRFENVEFGVTDRSVAVGGQQVSIQGIAAEYNGLFLPLHGAHQVQNLAVAIAGLEAFLGAGEQPLDQDVLQDGLAQVTSPGRLELLRTNPSLVIDAAHNPQGIEATATTLRETFNFSALGLVVGVLDDKDALGILTALFDHFGDEIEHLAITKSNSPRAIEPEQLTEIALDAGWDEDQLFTTQSVVDAMAWAVRGVRDIDARVQEAGRSLTAGTGGAGVLVTGSITLVGQVRELLGAETESPDASVEVAEHDDFSTFFDDDKEEDDES
ncbi:MAG: bifunctional folylpolyglutamate synthase/dihydrofolate synthase [Micrococcaceae bacterium]|nr:bifunctional folylpolyglutamate synthase/dihydrofolate synthase [Micrococcaceae bacterium]